MAKKKKDRSEEYRKRGLKRRKSIRSFEMVPDGIPPVQVEKTPVDVAAKIRKRIREECSVLTKRLTPKEFKFLLELYYGDSGGVQYKAYKATVKKPEMDNLTAAQDASRMKRSILAKIGEEGINEIVGFTLQRADRTVLGLLEAEYTKEYIHRDGCVVTGGTYPDNMGRAKGVELFYKRKGVGKDQEGTRPVVVNLVQYNPPNFPQWPGGGRADAPVAANMVPYQAPAALPSGTLGEPKDEG